MASRASGLDREEQGPRIAAFALRLAVGGQHLTGKADEVIGMARDIGDDGARLSQALRAPGGIDSRAPGGAILQNHRAAAAYFAVSALSGTSLCVAISNIPCLLDSLVTIK